MPTLIILTTFPLRPRGGVNVTLRPAVRIANPNEAIACAPLTLNSLQISINNTPFLALSKLPGIAALLQHRTTP